MSDLVSQFIGDEFDLDGGTLSIPDDFSWKRDRAKTDCVHLNFPVPITVKGRWGPLRIDSDLNAVQDKPDYIELLMDKWEFDFNIKVVKEWDWQ